MVINISEEFAASVFREGDSVLSWTRSQHIPRNSDKFLPHYGVTSQKTLSLLLQSLKHNLKWEKTSKHACDSQQNISQLQYIHLWWASVAQNFNLLENIHCALTTPNFIRIRKMVQKWVNAEFSPASVGKMNESPQLKIIYACQIEHHSVVLKADKIQ